MRHQPTSPYSGLTIVLSQPSRHDLDARRLLSSKAGRFFWMDGIRSYPRRDSTLGSRSGNGSPGTPEQSAGSATYTGRYIPENCDVRTSDTVNEGLLSGTRGILLLGERAFKEWTANPIYSEYNLNEQRGCRIESSRFGSDVRILCSYSPQDCLDQQDYESRGHLNPEGASNKLEWGGVEDAKGEKVKHKGRTSRGNFRWWLRQDVGKLLALMDGTWAYHPESHYHIYPSSDDIIHELTTRKSQAFYLDIETDLHYNILCFSFGFDLRNIYCVPCLDWHYMPAYSCLGHIFRALAIAMRDNEVVCHNTLFDLFILAWKYGIGVGYSIYDTMFSHKRSWPEIEKSLGHAQSHLGWEPYHKSEGVFSHGSREQMMQLLAYNGKDIRATVIAREGLNAHARGIPGLADSISQANSQVRPDLIMMLTGMKVNETKRRAFIEENDRKMMQYLRIIRILTKGYEVLPSSSPSMVKYFHHLLGYPVVARTATGGPSLDKGAMMKLKQKAVNKPELYDNPVIDLALAYRSLGTRTGWMKFIGFPTPDRCSCYWDMAETFRKRSSQILDTYGQNMQNPTSKACELFEAD